MTDPHPAKFHLGVVTGLQFEADIVRRLIRENSGRTEGQDSMSVACLGPGPDRAGDAARSLLDGGATALLSFGVAGGCDPALPPGAAIIATGVRDISAGGEALYTNRDWQRRLKSVLLGNVLVETAQIASTDKPLHKSRDKRGLFGDLGVAAVDMESAAIARAAIEATVPYMALRVVIDPQDLGLPLAAVSGMRPDGSTAVAAVTGSVLRRPGDLWGMIRLARYDRIARKALTAAAQCSAPLFASV
ncbi:MAG: squalene--hopene cyclase [Alphaproteobacteria bacterium]